MEVWVITEKEGYIYLEGGVDLVLAFLKEGSMRLGGSVVSGGTNSVVNKMGYFTNFLLDGRIPITNALSENAIRPVALARKNFLFSDTPQGAEASVFVFSIIETAKANCLDPYEWYI